jgi:uncharacterized membrane protein YraQ (UPF0718 family)
VENVYFDKIKDFILIFTSILYEAMPFVVLGAIVAGVLEEFLPQRLVARVLPRSRTLAIALGGLLGLIFPMCECGIIPVMRRLLRKGIPLSCCIAYLLAGPIINGVVMLSTYVAFSGQETHGVNQMGGLWMMWLRVILGYLVAFGTALIVERQYQKYGDELLTPLATPSGLPLVDEDDNGATEQKPLFKRVSNICETALHDFIDIMAFLILGALLAASVRMVLSNDTIAETSQNHPLLAILIMMGLAVLVTLCSEADAFVAATFVTLRPSAKLAFLVLGPMLDLKLILMYTRVFRPRLIRTIIVSVVVQVALYSYLTHVWWEYSYTPSESSAATATAAEK